MHARTASPSESRATGSAEFLSLLALVSQAAAVPLERVFSEAGLSSHALNESAGRTPIDSVRRAFRALERLSGEPLLGLKVAAQLRPGAFDLLDYVVQNAPTLRDACASFCRFLPLLSDAGRVWLVESGDQALLCHHADGAEPIVSQLIMGGIVHRASAVTGGRVRLRSVGFMHEARAPEAAYAALLANTKVSFRQICDSVSFDRAALELPLVGSDPTLARLLVRQAEAAMARIPTAPEAEENALRAAALELVLSGHASVERLAEKLGTTTRTLQRRLQEAGLSHRKLIDSVRADLVEQALATGDANLRSLARTLGYATPGSLRRARERWLEQSAG